MGSSRRSFQEADESHFSPAMKPSDLGTVAVAMSFKDLGSNGPGSHESMPGGVRPGPEA